MDLKPIFKAAKEGALGVPVPEVTFNNVVKHPLTYALILFALAGGFFIHEFVLSSKNQNKDCKQEIIYWKTAFTNERNINLQITNTLLFQKRDFNSYKDSVIKTDSTIRKRLIKKSLKVLKK